MKGIIFIRYTRSQKIGESNDLKVFGSKYTKEYKQNIAKIWEEVNQRA
jgi:hypothetical protein